MATMKKTVTKKTAVPCGQSPQRSKSKRLVTVGYTRVVEFKIPANELPPPVKRHRLHVAIMGCGGKGKPTRIIDNGYVMCYVGIGWVTEGDATAADYRKYPMVIEEPEDDADSRPNRRRKKENGR